LKSNKTLQITDEGSLLVSINIAYNTTTKSFKINIPLNPATFEKEEDKAKKIAD